ncbi:MAG TPA: CoA transferase [Steroidobacteraceae bacterium]|nr:CoA transferase [Steroidobacteraceae bacterium]
MTLGETYAGLRVLDLSTNIAGPYASMVLGDLGADVIKIERFPGGDDTRSLPPRWHEQATVFLAMNRNKRSVVLDLKTAEGRSAVLKLAASADVVVESFPPGVANELGLTFGNFRVSNPKIALCSISAFGDGPIGATMPGYDALVQAASGMMSFTGHPETASVRLAPSVLDLSTGLWATVGIMAALVRIEKSGIGEHVHASLLDAAFNLMSHQLLGYMATGELPGKLGSGAPSAAPYRVFAAADGEIMIATATDAQFARLSEALSVPAIAADPRFKTVTDRVANRKALDGLVAGRISSNSVNHWMLALSVAGISVSRVNTLGEALEMPVALERSLFLPAASLDSEAPLGLLRIPIDASSSSFRLAPPKLGEHSLAVLHEGGFSDAEIAALMSGKQGGRD